MHKNLSSVTREVSHQLPQRLTKDLVRHQETSCLLRLEVTSVSIREKSQGCIAATTSDVM